LFFALCGFDIKSVVTLFSIAICPFSLDSFYDFSLYH
jgi:hypothetical protein